MREKWRSRRGDECNESEALSHTHTQFSLTNTRAHQCGKVACVCVCVFILKTEADWNMRISCGGGGRRKKKKNRSQKRKGEREERKKVLKKSGREREEREWSVCVSVAIVLNEDVGRSAPKKKKKEETLHSECGVINEKTTKKKFSFCVSGFSG